MGKSVQVNKPHKARFASKASRHLHRTSLIEKGSISKEQKHVGKGARAARIQRNKMIRNKKRAALLKEKRASTGPSSPPRVIVLFGLSVEVNLKLLAKDMMTLLVPEVTAVNSATIVSPNYKIRTKILEAPYGDLLSCMEMAKVADLMVFVASGNSMHENSESILDSFGSKCLSVMRTMGLPTAAVLIRDLPVDPKRKQDLKKVCVTCLASELPEDCKFYLADGKEDLHKFLRLFKDQHLSSPHWRQRRPYLLSEEVAMEHDVENVGKCSLVLTGYVRAHSFSVNQLVHISGVGDFQLSKIDVLKDPFPMNHKKNMDLMESDEYSALMYSLLPDPSKLEPLLVENVTDPHAGEQTWPTEAEMVEAENANKKKKAKKKILPRGTSDYQAAWIVDESDEAGSDTHEDEGEGYDMDLDEGKDVNLVEEDFDHSDIDELTSRKDIDDETETDTVMADNETLTRDQIEAEIQKLKDAHAEDEEFPDEVDTPLDNPARRRFAKFRGMKSFRTSAWDPKELLPWEYSKIFAFDNFTKTQKCVLNKTMEIDQNYLHESASVGSFVKLHVKQVPVSGSSKICSLSNRLPLIISGLLQHESKMSVLHFSIKKDHSYDAPIKSKENLIFHVGFRQFIARPVFSSDNINSDKHKMERFLHPGRFSIASVFAPISFPPLPLVVLKGGQGDTFSVVATGSLKSVDPDRIILKKIILTGYPQRVSKCKGIVRFMFHNPEDVRWFKPVDLWTKCGRHGRIKEPVGTHGAMKCVFNGVIPQHDTVCMSLYKRAYPKWPQDHYNVLEYYF